jgi:hypothetical protein
MGSIAIIGLKALEIGVAWTQAPRWGSERNEDLGYVTRRSASEPGTN